MFDNEYYGADEGAKKPKFAEDEELDGKLHKPNLFCSIYSTCFIPV